MNYKSPIELIVGQMNLQMEESICKAVQNVSVNVDKEELLKALQYDRNQYQKGYSDRDAEIVRCKDCKHFEPDGIYTMCYRHNGLSQNADWFCADGERK